MITALTSSSDFVLPAERSVRGVLAGCMDAVGIPVSTPTASGHDERERLGIPLAEKVCVVLVDGLGALNLAERLGYAPHLRAWDRRAISSVAPSTTAASITAFGTGALPGRTAMLSYALRSRRTGQSFSLIKWTGSREDPEEWQGVPTLFEQAANAGVLCAAIQPSAYRKSGLTRAALRGSVHRSGESMDERARAAGRFLREGKLAYLYWDGVDHAGHGYGWRGEEWSQALEEFDAGLGTLERSLPGGTLIVLTADHGMIDVEERVDIAEHPELEESVSLISGEERAVHLYTDDPERVRARWQEVLGEAAVVLTKVELEESGIFGPMGETAREVCGDVVSFQRRRLSVVDSRRRRPGSHFMPGVHGSLTEQEMTVPLVMHEASSR